MFFTTSANLSPRPVAAVATANQVHPGPLRRRFDVVTASPHRTGTMSQAPANATRPNGNLAMDEAGEAAGC
jgi:hypothetical protein